MRWLSLLLVLLPISSRAFILNKCCPIGEHKDFDQEGECVPSHFPKQYENKTDNWPWWFPSQPIYSKTSNATSRVFPNKAKLSLGFKTPCSNYDVVTNEPNVFRFYDDGSLQIFDDFTLHTNVQRGNYIYPPDSFCIDRYTYHQNQERWFPEALRSLCLCNQSLPFLISMGCRAGNGTGGTTPVFSSPALKRLSEVAKDYANQGKCCRSYTPNEDDDFFVEICPCQTAVCVLKCCEYGFLLNVPSPGKNISIEDCSVQIDREVDWLPDGIDKHYVMRQFPECDADEKIVFQKINLNSSTLNSDGSININGRMKVGKEKFCYEVGYREETNEFDNYIMKCTKKSTISTKQILYGTLSVIGAFFLLLTIIVHVSLPRHYSVNDRNLLSQTWSLFIAYVGFVVANFAINDMPHWLCITVGFIIQYASLASFFWLNVLCIDLTRAFTKLRVIRNAVLWQQQRRFLQYSLYAWLSPAAIVLITIVMDFSPNIPKHYIKPEFSTWCWFRSDTWAQFVYFYCPIAVILIVNIILFLYTIYKIRAVQMKVSSLLQNSASQEKKRTILYMKLFVLMGLSWIFELISWFVQGPDYYWYALDVINLLRAIFIFIVLCCKREVLERLQEKLHVPIARGRQKSSPSVVTMTSQTGPRTPPTPTTPF